MTYLIGKESTLALLAVERWSVVDHLWMNLDFVDPLHVIPQLFQVPNVAITDFANDKVALTTGRRTAGSLHGLSGHRPLVWPLTGGTAHGSTPTRQGSDGNTGL